MEGNTKNITGQGQIDRDILQCKADILQAWNSSKPAKHQPAPNSGPAIDISEITPQTEPPKKTEPLRPVAEKQQLTQETISKPEDSPEDLIDPTLFLLDAEENIGQVGNTAECE